MTHPPTAPPASLPVAPAPPGPAAAPPGPPPGASPEPPRRSALAEGWSRVRAAARTEPGRLRIMGAVIAGLLVLFGGVSAWQVADRSAAADTVVDSSQPLSTDAAEIYRLLADANTTAAAEFLAGANGDAEARGQYERDVDRAGRLLAQAAAHGAGTGRSQEIIEQLNEQFLTYTGLVETARANNRQGFPLGGAYLRYADEQMQKQDGMLDLAEELYALETQRLRDDISAAKSWPWPAMAAGVVALVVLAWAQRRNYQRTNRVFNPGMLAATAATVLLLWLAGAQTLARSNLNEADSSGVQSLNALNEARTEALKARGQENLVLVARGAGDTFEANYQDHMAEFAGEGNAQPGGADGESLLGRASSLADDDEGRQPIEEAMAATEEWRNRHEMAREAELAGDYNRALGLVIGPEDSSGQFFGQVDQELGNAVAHEQEEFEAAADSGRGALGGLLVGAVALAVLGAACVVAGIGRRLAEYR
ncbi:hypothetical protein [Streptomyces sp. 6N223]|uniref:hypothetical protein n=1 Tax=Streptomyces sp. 6N223 TaxID=3457412 RepID=UPI003FD06BF9